MYYGRNWSRKAQDFGRHAGLWKIEPYQETQAASFESHTKSSVAATHFIEFLENYSGRVAATVRGLTED
jgi:hypothetical protein